MVKLEIWIIESNPEMAGRVQKALLMPNPIVKINLQKSRIGYGYFHFVAQCDSQDFVDSLKASSASIEGMWVNEYPPDYEERFKSSGPEN